MKLLERIFNRMMKAIEKEGIAEMTYNLLEQHGFFTYKNYHEK